MNVIGNDIAKNLPGIVEQINKVEKLEELYWLHGYISALIQNHKTAAIIPATNGHFVLNGNVSETSAESETETITILYGTQSGNSKKVANQLFEKAQLNKIPVKLQDMGDYDPKNIKNEKQVFIIVSTHGDGEPPLAAEGLLEFLSGKKAPKLDQLKYAVLALGDKGYVNFCKTGADFDQQLTHLGAQRVLERVECDVNFQPFAEKWIDSVISAIEKTVLNSRSKPTLSGSGPVVQKSTLFTRENPGKLLVTESINLNGRGSKKRTIHLELSAEDQPFDYYPGDSLGIYFENPEALVDDILSEFNFSGSENIYWQKEPYLLRDFLLKKAELTQLNREVIENYLRHTRNKELEEVLKESGRLSKYLYGRDVLDLLHEYPVSLTPQELVNLLRPMQPRLYSIASSPLYVQGEVHITVDVLKYEYKNRKKHGVCSGYVSSGLEVGSYVTAFVSGNEVFRLPDESKDVIMIGPGTGIAPFRAFLQHREASGAKGRNWLFFGSQHFTTDFIYQTELQKFKKDQVLHKLDVAFSRDQEEKIYVQHRMQQRSKELFSWIENGAHIFICGDKNNMARDVLATFCEIVSKEGGMSQEKANEYMKSLRKQKRYLEDVY